jgi:hypothetical protein
MFPANAHEIHIETDPHAPVLLRLAALDETRPLLTPALVGHVRGVPAAALSLVDDRTVADPFVYTDPLRAVLRTRATGIVAGGREPSLSQRMLDRLGARFRPGAVPA